MRPFRKKLKTIDTVLASLAAVCIATIFIENEYFLFNNYQSTGLCTALRILILLMSLVAVGCLIYRSLIYLQFIRLRDNYPLDQPGKEIYCDLQ
jgi:hypothetical protein